MSQSVRSMACEFRLLATGKPYVARNGAIRINPNEPSLCTAVADVYQNSAYSPAAYRAAAAVSDAYHGQSFTGLDDLAANLAMTAAAKVYALFKVKLS